MPRTPAPTGSVSDRAVAVVGSDPPAADVDALATLEHALGNAFDVRQTARTREFLVHLDTADGRLGRAGIDLVYDPSTERLRAYRRSAPPVEQSTGPIEWPALVSAVPAGAVRDVIGGPVSIRALVPVSTTETEVLGFDVLDDDGKTVTRLRWRQGHLVEPGRQPIPVDAAVTRLRGYGGAATTVERLVGASVPLSDGTGWLASVRGARGSTPTLGPRFVLHPDLAADFAVADALLGYLDRMEANLDGILADVDTEFLHQFRVEVRRSRSVLKLLGDVLPADPTGSAAAQLRWLGDVTTPTRDLDVYLLEMDDLAAELDHPAALIPLADHIRRRRSARQAALAVALRSSRCTDFLAQWRSELTQVFATRSTASVTVAELADERIRRCLQKVRKRADAITPTGPGESIHALRKACKEMRYLLELFRPLCHAPTYKKVVAEFKELQDVLGEFQDGEVQGAGLRVFATEMLDEGHADADAILAMGELSAHFHQRQQVARAALTERPGGLVSPRLATRVGKLVVW